VLYEEDYSNFSSSNINAVTEDIIASEPLIPSSKTEQVKTLVESMYLN